MIKKVFLSENDPLHEFKKKICSFLGLEAVNRENDAELLDLQEENNPENIALFSQSAKVLISPLAAGKISRNNLVNLKNVYTAFPLRYWALAQKILQTKKNNICGELTSIRITWTRPGKNSSDEETFLHDTLANIIHTAGSIAETPLELLHLEKVPGENNLFALAMFKGEIAVEIEANETMPDTMPDTHFIKANFTEGIITNKPIVGHFNEEGSIYASNNSLQRFIAEIPGWECGDEILNTRLAMYKAIIDDECPAGLLDSREIYKATTQALKTNMPVNFGEEK
jgi:hypothetical protein